MTMPGQIPDRTDAFAQTHAAAQLLIDAIRELDQEALAALPPEERRAQFEARQAVYAHFDRVWTDAKRRGLAPGTQDAWAGMAGLRDLTDALWTNVTPAEAGTQSGSGI